MSNGVKVGARVMWNNDKNITGKVVKIEGDAVSIYWDHGNLNIEKASDVPGRFIQLIEIATYEVIPEYDRTQMVLEMAVAIMDCTRDGSEVFVVEDRTALYRYIIDLAGRIVDREIETDCVEGLYDVSERAGDLIVQTFPRKIGDDDVACMVESTEAKE